MTTNEKQNKQPEAGPESQSVLDNTGVHPESYGAAEKLLAACGYTLEDVKNGSIAGLKEKAEALGLENLAQRCGAGHPPLFKMELKFVITINS